MWLAGALAAAVALAAGAGCADDHGLDDFVDPVPVDGPDAGPLPVGPPGFSNPAEPPACPSQGQLDRFCDAADVSGIDLVRPVDFASVTGGIALFDADGDGDLDLFATAGQEPAVLFVNDGTGRFANATAGSGLAGVVWATGVAAGDLDRDGDTDLVVTGHDQRYRLFRGGGDGTFTERGLEAGLRSTRHEGMSAVLHDVNGDGLLDIYITNWISPDQPPGVPGFYAHQAERNYLFVNEGDLRFEEVALAAGASGGNSTSLAAAFFDSNDDGVADLHVANDFGMGDGTQPNLDLRGNGDGTFRPVASGASVGIFAMSMSPGDYDNDGDVDIYTTNIGRNVLLQNTGGLFADVAEEAGVEGYGFFDPRQELFPYPAFDPSSENVLLAGLTEWADRYLHVDTPVHTTTGWAANWLDYDHDGDLDLHVCNGFLAVRSVAPEARRQPNFMYRNDGDGTFTDVTSAAGVGDRGDARSCVTGDIDGDGDLDVVVGNTGFDFDAEGGKLVVLRNDAAAGNWLQVELRGTASNTEGIGAVVRARTGTTVQTRVVSGGDGFLGTSMRRPHFGLGTHAVIDELTIHWPSGTTTVVLDIPANQILAVTE